jgi:glycosyltransferase involved in cell wall biosynthesis
MGNNMTLESTKCLSVVIPCYNEEETIFELLSRVLEQPSVGQVIVVDDGSTDKSVEIASRIIDNRVIIEAKGKNEGKGSAIKAGFKLATRPYVLIQDADLEYDPTEYENLLKPLLSGHADVVYGSRFLASGARRAVYYWHRVGNNVLTWLSNMFTNIDLTDMETCYKVMRTEIAQDLEIKEQRFGLEPEMTARLAKLKLRIYEVPISYYGRTYEEGKKITWKDGFSAIRCILKYNLFNV